MHVYVLDSDCLRTPYIACIYSEYIYFLNNNVAGCEHTLFWTIFDIIIYSKKHNLGYVYALYHARV